MNKIFTLVTICLALFACAGCGAVEPPAARTSAAPNSAQADAAAQADDQKNGLNHFSCGMASSQWRLMSMSFKKKYSSSG
ncbi:MAG: hypothetical protein SOZ01_05290 [Selenomonadaceae bacterium]|nr:hypothetical protein [Selenomonadaceae bacterium]